MSLLRVLPELQVADASGGSSGPGGVLSHDKVSRKSRTNCLSIEVTDSPSRYCAMSQKRDESGVKISSIRVSCESMKPNSNLVSARMTPRRTELCAAKL